MDHYLFAGFGRGFGGDFLNGVLFLGAAFLAGAFFFAAGAIDFPHCLYRSAFAVIVLPIRDLEREPRSWMAHWLWRQFRADSGLLCRVWRVGMG